MQIHLTPDILEAAYNLLRQTRPFRGWKLPDGEEVAFHVVATDRVYADHHVGRDGHCIRVSQRRHYQLATLLQTMAHEMCHMREVQLKVRNDIAHGRVFQQLKAQVCRFHGFDPGMF